MIGPVVEISNEDGPRMWIRVRCGGCGALLAEHEFNADTDTPDIGAIHGEAHARAWLAHECP